MRTLLIAFALLLLAGEGKAQWIGCAGADDLNQTSAFTQPGSPEDTSIDYGCAVATTQWVWYGYFTVCQGGTLNLYSTCGSSAYDVDLVVWGPFNSTAGICSQLTSGNIAACSATTAQTETVTLNNVLANEVYMVAAVADTNQQTPLIWNNGTAVITGSCLPSSNCGPFNGYESLCMVTVDSATQEYQLVWNEIAGNPVSYFGILKADYMGNPQQIDTVQISSLSQYIDFAADPAVHAEQYFVRTYDTCSTYWEQPGVYIQPVFCQSSLSTQGTVNVAWSPYIDISGNGPAYYVIYRGATPNNMTAIDTVATFVNNYTDINPLSGTSYYKIGTALYSACVPMRLQQNAQSAAAMSFSNAAPITVVGINENSLGYVSVFPNPTEGNITIKNMLQPSVLRVYDVAGRVVREENLDASQQQTVNLGSLEAGVYSVMLENETGYFRKEIFVQR